jgi:hypothetical protein
MSAATNVRPERLRAVNIRLAARARVLLVFAATSVFVGGCLGTSVPRSSVSATAGALSGPSGTSASSPTPTSLPTPASSPSPTLRPSLVPFQTLTWRPLATEGWGSTSTNGTLSSADAYIEIGADQRGLSSVSISTDGTRWETTVLGVSVKPCPAYGSQPDSSLYAATSDANQILVGGVEYATDLSPCGSSRAVTWISSDGRTWQRSRGFGAVLGFAQVQGLWPIPGGWEALVGTSTGGPTTIWRSADGLDWHQLTELVAPNEGDMTANVAAADDGTRVATVFNGQIGSPVVVSGLRGGESSLLKSTDGLHWDAVDLTLPNGRSPSIVPPAPGGPAVWLLITTAADEPPIIWASTDLLDWTQGTFPRAKIGRLVSTRYGFIATGSNLCGDGGTCAADSAQYGSIDGLHWTRFASAVSSTDVVDGPAGVLAFSGDGSKAWLLTP